MSDPVAELTTSQLRDALGLAGDLAAYYRPDEMTQLLRQLPELLGCDMVLIGEVHLAEDGATPGPY